MDTRSKHVPTLKTEDETFFFFTTPLAGLAGLVCCPLTICGMPTIIPPRVEAVGVVFGRYVGTWRQPGLVCINPCGLQMHFVSINNRSHELQAIKASDAAGNSVVVSGVITYRVVDSARACLDMEHGHLDSYVRTQAHAVLKRVASRFPYITYDGSPCLITEQTALGSQLAALLQEKCNPAGVVILSFELTDLSYAAEIAPQMLVRQQATAIIDARQTIVKGAVGIVTDALASLGEKGVPVDGAERGKLVSNLMTVLCSEKSPVPTISM